MGQTDYTPEQIKAASSILAILYGFIGIFPVFWGFPFDETLEQDYILLFFSPFLLMSVSFYLLTRRETGGGIGAFVGLVIVLSSVGLALLGLWGNIVLLLAYGLIYGMYYIRAFSFGEVHDAEFRGIDSVIEATTSKVIYTPFILIFLLLLSLASQ